MADEETKLEETPEKENSVAEEPKEKKTIWQWLQEHPKTVFATRVLAWTCFAMVLPFVFIAYRYGLFRDNGAISVSGWGIIAIIIVLVFAITVINYIRKGLKPGMLKQCVMGVVKVIIPLVAVLLIVQGIRTDIDLFTKALGVTIACELVAIPLNPFPAWLEKRRKEQNLEEQEGMFEAMWNKFFAKKKENEKE